MNHPAGELAPALAGLRDGAAGRLHGLKKRGRAGQGRAGQGRAGQGRAGSCGSISQLAGSTRQ